MPRGHFSEEVRRKYAKRMTALNADPAFRQASTRMRYAGSVPDDSKRTPGQEKAARGRKARLFGGMFVLACAFPPIINSIDNPRVAMLHGPDVVRLVAVGLCLGFGLALLLSALIRGE